MTQQEIVELMAPTDFLLPAGCDLLITELILTEDLFVVAASPTTTYSRCPICGSGSDKVHSRYQRTVADVPVGGRQLVLR